MGLDIVVEVENKNRDWQMVGFSQASVGVLIVNLKRIYLLPDFQALGLGKRLITKTINWTKKLEINRILLETHIRNFAQFAFKKNGFEISEQKGEILIMKMDV